MRIIAGVFGGRRLLEPKGHRTHPMSERIRGALFNTLGSIDGLTVLDCFAGSGAISIEAVSRGAKQARAIEVDRHAFEIVKANRDSFTDEQVMPVHRANVASWVDNNPDVVFDIVIADPPFDSVSLTVLKKCATTVKQGGLLVLSVPPRFNETFENFELIDQKKYGDASLLFYKRLK